MRWHRFLSALVLFWCSSGAAIAQEGPIPTSSAVADISSTLLPISDFHLKLRPKVNPARLAHPLTAVGPDLGVEASFGTAFCVDQACRLIGTNYHVAVAVQSDKIKGIEVVRRYLATGPDDDGVSLNGLTSDHPLSFNASRDLAIFELRHPLPHYHGLAYSLDDLEPGQQVEIYGYPKESLYSKRHLMQFHGVFKGKTDLGLLLFDYGLSAGKRIFGGASGGLVVDSRTRKIVGILNEATKDGKTEAVAVPVQSLADFVRKVQPFLAQSIFPSETYISPVAADVYPRFAPETSSLGLRHRPEESLEVTHLRANARSLVEGMRDFVAVQTFAWGSGNKEPAAQAAYEVHVLDGGESYRQYPDGKQELDDVPSPPLNHWVIPGSDWSDLPRMASTNPRFRLREAPEVVKNGKPMRVFQFRADPEDGVCAMRTVWDFGFFTRHKTEITSCYGEVWTDEDTNILRISEHMDLYDKSAYQTVVTYGWLRRGGEEPRLIPTTISSEHHSGKKVDWCRGQFIDYRTFGSKIKLRIDEVRSVAEQHH